MEKTVLKEKLEKGFNVAIIAELCDCSIGRINELKREIDFEFLANRFNLNIDELKEAVNTHVNVNAIFGFCEKHQINVEEWPDETVEEALKQRAKAVKKDELKVGDILPNGEELVKIQKAGNTFTYVTKEFNVYTKKQIAEMNKEEA